MSFVLNKNNTTFITVTLTENSLLTSPYYLFEFQNQQSNVKYYCIQPVDSSSEQDRSNRFYITEKVTPDNLNGEINLVVGDYNYKVYEQASNTNLDPTGLTMVESGICSVIDLVAEENKIYDTTTTNKVYNG